LGHVVKAYVGQGNMTAGAAMVQRLKGYGLGLCLCPGELPPLLSPWFFDNGAFRDWRAGRAFDGEGFLSALAEIGGADLHPDFLVVPDVVGAGLDSLRKSLEWLPRIQRLAPRYLAVQDGMEDLDVRPHVAAFDGIFVGGTFPWKIATGAKWADFVHERGKPCHVGRIGTPRYVRWAFEIGADSIDSSAPLWSLDKLAAWDGALTPARGLDENDPESTGSAYGR